MLFDKIYLINLARESERLERISSRIEAAFLKVPVLRIEGIDGRAITREYLDESRISLLDTYRDPAYGNAMLSGQIGQALSHVTAWSQLQSDDAERVLVLEDDAVFGDDFANRCLWLERELVGIDWELVYLARRKLAWAAEDKLTDNLVRPRHSAWTLAYILSKQGAAKLLDSDYLQKLVPADEYLPWAIGNGSIYLQGAFSNAGTLRAVAPLPGSNFVSPEEGAELASDTAHSEPLPHLDSPVSTGAHRFLAVTIADGESDGLDRLRSSCSRFGAPLRILNGEGLDGPGRAKLLADELGEHAGDPDLIVFVLEPENTVIGIHPFRMVDLFKDMRSNVLFLGRKFFWEGLAMEPGLERSSGNRHGWEPSGAPPGARPLEICADCFAGYADVLAFLLRRGADAGMDLQEIALDSLSRNEGLVTVDYYTEVFQSLYQAMQELRLDFFGGSLVNRLALSRPAVVTGSAPLYTRMFMNKISNYISGNWRQAYGQCAIGLADYDDSRSIYLAVAGTRGDVSVEGCLSSLSALSYPKERITLVYYAGVPGQAGLARNALPQAAAGYSQALVKDLSAVSSSELREAILADAAASGCDGLFVIDNDVTIVDPHILQRMIRDNRRIVGPMLKKRSQPNWSNFWGDVSPSGLYALGVDYMEIVNGQKRGLWRVFYIAGACYFRADVIQRVQGLYLREPQPGRTGELAFCENLRELGFHMFLDNTVEYGYKLEAKKSPVAAAM